MIDDRRLLAYEQILDLRDRMLAIVESSSVWRREKGLKLLMGVGSKGGLDVQEESRGRGGGVRKGNPNALPAVDFKHLRRGCSRALVKTSKNTWRAGGHRNYLLHQ